MLPLFRTYILVNNSGQTLSFSGGGRIIIRETAWKLTAGVLDPTVLTEDDLGFTTGTLTDGSEIIGDVQLDNSSDLYWGSQVQIEIKHDAGTAADGTFDLYMAEGNVTGELSSDADGYADAESSDLYNVGSLTWQSDGQNGETMRSQAFAIE